MNKKSIFIALALLIASIIITAIIFHKCLSFDARLKNCAESEDLRERFECQNSLRNMADTNQRLAKLEAELGLTEFRKIFYVEAEARMTIMLEAKKHFEKAIKTDSDNSEYKVFLESIDGLIENRYD